jgi:putative peptide zinc metalloprotease protein
MGDRMSLPHNLRLRPDLIIEPQDQTSGTWVVKDPVSLRFFLFGGDERFIMDRLDGRQSMDQIVDDFARERAPKRMTLERLQSFLAALHRNGLASSDAPRQGRIMLERADEQQWRESVLGWSNLLAIRLPGFNPDGMLDRAYSWLRWCFSWWFLACASMMCAIAVGIVIADWDSFRLAWPRLYEFVSGRNLIWLGAALVLTKCLHEIAHALTCKHFGGKCHEMGVILLVFMPCLYCNVTDAWMLRSRWQRIAISAAGMIVELFLAAAAMLLWRYSQPGPLNSICLNVIVVCGVSTLLFNGNPLLKHDGYYILSDLIRMPNLWQESRAYLYRKLGGLFRTANSGREEVPPDHPWLLIAYAVGSTIYRICLTIGILLFLYRALHPKGMDLIVVVIAVSIVLQTAIVRSTPIARWWKDPTKWKRLNKRASSTLGVVVAAILCGALFLPLPASVTAPVVLQPRDTVKVFVTSPGVITQSVAVGDEVEKGQAIAALENAELTNERLAAASELTRSQARVRTLQLRLNDDANAAAQLALAQEILADLTEQARLRDKEFGRLTIASPAAGTVLPPPPASAKTNDKELPAWSGSPLEPENRVCYLERGTLLCLVGDPSSYEAVALIDETDLPYVKVGQTVRLQVEHAPAEILSGRVVEIAEVKAETAPVELTAEREIAVHDSPSHGPKPIRTLYQARIEIDASDIPLVVGSRGTVRIKVAPQTIASKLTRWARSTFTADPKP